MKNYIYNLKDYGIMPGGDRLLTDEIQKVLDLAGETGGTVLIPAGNYRTGGLLMHGNTELRLEAGATLTGSGNPDDYTVFPVKDTVKLHTDMEMIAEYFDKGKHNVRNEYRRAIISAYGEENIVISGEGADSVIDGVDCYDPEGEEHLRGPHGIFISNCRNVKLQDYTIKNTGNFLHQIDTCENVTVNNIKALGGHDGFHLHECRNVEIENSVIHSGDDCIAGINMEDVHIHDCDLNTSCQLFRIGGKHILTENCHMWGPGEYPYRASAVIDGKHLKAKEQWHTDIVSMIEFFASEHFTKEPSEDIVFENCNIENPGKLLYYVFGEIKGDGAHYCGVTPLNELKFSNCRISGKCSPAVIKAPENAPLTITLECVDYPKNMFDESAENLIVINK